MNNSAAPRISSLTIARALGTILVLVGHAEPIKELLPGLWKFFSLVRMPFFFFIGGFIVSPKARLGAMPFLDFFKKYCIPFVLPYFAISASFTIFKIALSGSVKRSIEFPEIIGLIIAQPWKNPALYLWFIYALFFIRLASFFIKSTPKVLIIAISLSLLIWRPIDSEFFAIGTILHFLPFFLLGFLASSFKQHLLDICSRWWVPLLSTLLLLGVFFFSPFPNWEKTPLRNLMGCIGVITILGIASKLDKLPIHKYANIISEYGIEIYLLQFFFIFPISRILGTLHFPPATIVPFSFLGGLIGPILVAHQLFSKSKLLATVFSGRTHNKAP